MKANTKQAVEARREARLEALKAELERLFRDIQAARYHPLQKEVQAAFAGATALGQSTAEIY